MGVLTQLRDYKPVKRLLGEGLCAEDFNDDCLGRALDAIYKYGITSLFSDLAFSIGVKEGLLGRSAHIDTTSLSVYGDYDNEETAAPEPRHGHSKDHRPDLKQLARKRVINYILPKHFTI